MPHPIEFIGGPADGKRPHVGTADLYRVTLDGKAWAYYERNGTQAIHTADAQEKWKAAGFPL